MKKSLLFLLMTFATSWTLAFAYSAFGGEMYRPSWCAMAISFMFTPMVCALIVQKLVYRQAICGPLGVSFRPNAWFMVGWLLPPVVAVVATGASLLMPGIQLCLDPAASNLFEFLRKSVPAEKLTELQGGLKHLPLHPFLLTLVGGTIVGATFNAIAGFGEELGWRGLLQMELAHLGFWKSSWLIGLVWGIWHIPFIVHGYNYPGHPVAGAFMMTAWTILFTPLIAHVRLKSGSVIAASIMHGTINGTAAAPLVLVNQADSLTVGVMGIPGLCVLALLNVGLYWVRAGARVPREEIEATVRSGSGQCT